MSDKANFGNTKKRRRGRPRVGGRQIYVPLRLRTGRSEEEDRLIERLESLVERGQRSRYIRRVLLTGDVEPVLDQIFQEESDRTRQGFDAMFDMWEIDDD